LEYPIDGHGAFQKLKKKRMREREREGGKGRK
jgi:hypothetical protein